MSHIILQPSGSKDAKEHYENTVKKPVDISRLAKFIKGPELDNLKKMYPDGQVPVWGVTPGKNDANKGKWDKIEPSDIVLFSGDKKIFSSATVSYKLHNKALATDLWGTDADGNTWEYIYFLDEVNKHEIPYELFNRVVGYSPNYIIQGFNVLDDVKSESFIIAFDLSSSIYYPSVSEEEYVKAVKEFDRTKGLDSEAIVQVRNEQSYLRKHLFHQKKSARCAICARELPVNLLVTSHIKKRAECTDEEKLDLNVVVPMCSLGCDALYEKGYIAVSSATEIKIHQLKTLPKDLISYLKGLDGNICSYHNDNNSKYFEWHENITFKGE